MPPPLLPRAPRPLLWLMVPLLILCACQIEPESLGGEAPVASELGRSGPVLVRLAACSTGLPLANELIEACPTDHGRLLFELEPANSQIALELVLAGQADLAIVGEEVDLEALSGEGAKGRGLIAQVLAIDAIGVIVHRDHPLREISTADLAALFGGYHLDWEELDAGSGQPELVCREQGSAARIVFERLVMGDSPVSSAAVVMPHDQGVVEHVAQHPGAVGYVSTAYADDRVRLVAIDGVLPTASEIGRGRYPLTHPLVLVTSPEAPREASRLVEFARSAQGRRLIGQSYVLPR